MLALAIAVRMDERLAGETVSDASGHCGDLWELTDPHLKQIVHSEEADDWNGENDEDVEDLRDVVDDDLDGFSLRSLMDFAAARNAESALNPHGRLRRRTRYVHLT